MENAFDLYINIVTYGRGVCLLWGVGLQPVILYQKIGMFTESGEGGGGKSSNYVLCIYLPCLTAELTITIVQAGKTKRTFIEGIH